MFNCTYDYSLRLYLATHILSYFNCLIIHIKIKFSYMSLLFLVFFCFTWLKKKKKIRANLIKLLKSAYEFIICLLNSTFASQTQ